MLGSLSTSTPVRVYFLPVGEIRPVVNLLIAYRFFCFTDKSRISRNPLYYVTVVRNRHFDILILHKLLVILICVLCAQKIDDSIFSDIKNDTFVAESPFFCHGCF